MSKILGLVGDRIVITREEKEDEKKSGGIILPDTMGAKFNVGTVIAVSPDLITEQAINVGERVLYVIGEHWELEADGEDAVLLWGKDIVAVIE